MKLLEILKIMGIMYVCVGGWVYNSKKNMGKQK